ncbi:spoIIIJ-associated protein [Salana multivorans]|uniref:SpoIIIJ-associated protein n=1 Tax=Salana multivorans TaxID=120377 RepID=A0A3N2DA55_9MICO|nr:R3H domain-containing nucleic acid-binding protein [Salana multivorans]MBN8882967.1 single-stranded DNA-binding protein [Salana multivorans]ROR96667.1 spoIIIJ-associated protein [Salana multivorans]
MSDENKDETLDVTSDEAAATPSEQSAESTSDKPTRLEEEGEIAADYLEELLDIADLDGDIELGVEHGRAAVEIVSDDESPRALQGLVGRDGEVLDALQELTRLAVQARTGERSRLMLDVGGFRATQRRELVALANETVARVRSTGESVALAPMNPYQRKVVHDAVADAGLVSDSEGVEPNRRVVVRPAQD